jgi:uncharacterized phiE125 gp8 family phage protein
MALVLVTAPAAEPVTLAEAKAHLRITGTDEDVLISSLMITSRLTVESAVSVGLITQTWRLVMDQWPKGAVEIPLSPLQAVTAIRVKDRNGIGQVVPSTSYLVDITSLPPRLVWNGVVPQNPGVPAVGIEIDLTIGFGATGAVVPAPLRHAILMLIAHWYEHRDPEEIGTGTARIPDAVTDLIQPFRKIRL